MYFCCIDLQTELSDVFAFEDIHQLVKDVPMFAKSLCPVWKVKWRGIDIIVKGLVDETNSQDEPKLHKYVWLCTVISIFW